MAMAVQEMYLALKSYGPVIENGFYYDFMQRAFTSDDLKKLKKCQR